MGAIPGKKCSTSEKNHYSMIEVLAKISSTLYCIINIYHKKCMLLKKNHRVDRFTI
jgi:hypothetical protein